MALVWHSLAVTMDFAGERKRFGTERKNIANIFSQWRLKGSAEIFRTTWTKIFVNLKINACFRLLLFRL